MESQTENVNENKQKIQSSDSSDSSFIFCWFCVHILWIFTHSYDYSKHSNVQLKFEEPCLLKNLQVSIIIFSCLPLIVIPENLFEDKICLMNKLQKLKVSDLLT